MIRIDGDAMKDYHKARQNLIDMYIKSLDEGKIPWEQMWKTSAPENGITKTKYRGVNNLILSFVAQNRGYKDNRWCTYSQMIKKKWTFIKDAKGQGVCIEYWSKYNKKDKKSYTFSEYEKIIKNNPELEPDFKTVMRLTTVFNGDLIDGLANNKQEQKEDIISNDYVDNIINNLGVEYEEKGEEAYYSPMQDKVVVPPSNSFKTSYSYYATQLHELSHSTGHESRLDRNIKNHFGTKDYAKEELRAEISSSFLMQKFGLEYDERHLNNHKSYIQSWLEVLKNNPQELFDAIADSNKIVDYLEQSSLEKNKDLSIDLEEALEI